MYRGVKELRTLSSTFLGAGNSPKILISGCKSLDRAEQIKKIPAESLTGARARPSNDGVIVLTVMMLTAGEELLVLGLVLKCFLIFPATNNWCSFSDSPSFCRETPRDEERFVL